MASNKVIVFGPTGNVGSFAARSAQEHGAKVFLAMRDPQKSIPGLTADAEKAGGFERVQADLLKPDSLSAAVSKSGAKRAFVYLMYMSPDHMLSSLQALKSAGIEFVVFLSSYTVSGNPEDVPQSEIIPYKHAQVELNLEKTFPGKYVAVRPGGFATNTLRELAGIQKGEVKFYVPEAKFDYITDNDMGAVGGVILANGPKDGQKRVFLVGPDEIEQQDAIRTIAKAIGKDVTITPIDQEAGVKQAVERGLPPPIAKYLMSKMGGWVGNERHGGMLDDVSRREALTNAQKYTGKPTMKFDDWVQQNKDRFTA